MTRKVEKVPDAGWVFPGELAGTRVALHPLRAGDRALFESLYGDPRVMAQVGAPLAAARRVRAFDSALADSADAQGSRRLWRIQVVEGGDAGGLLGLSRGDHGMEVGALLLASAQGRGLATDAIAVLARAVFASPGVDRLWARHRTDHPAAAALMRTLGFRPGPLPADGTGWTAWFLDRPAYPG
ncbi:MAG: GNAT family N-acetyltransferase [Xanthomonadales bacterium]|nr:GNAT family N-acetyltransferase [Xanthomonadales bacterium]